MAATTLLSIGMRAMVANYAALQTTGHNIANASVAGYSRQQVELATSTGQFTGAGFFGKGVDVQTVSRSHNAFLTREAATSRSLASMDAARLQALKQVESVFRPGEQGVGYAAGEFLNSIVDLASQPADSAARQVVLARASDVADRFAAAGEQLDAVQAGVSEDLRTAVATVNELARSIAAVNQKIAGLSGLGQPANDLLDERDRLIGQLSDLVQVSTIAADDGTVGVFIGGGQRLVLGHMASSLSVVADASDPARSALAINEGGLTRTIDEDSLGGGAIAGWLQFQNNDLVLARTQLGQMAAALSGVVNAQQALGLDLSDPPGSGAAIFSVGGPRALPTRTNERDGAGDFVAEVQLSVTDATQLVASEYDLRVDPAAAPGTWRLTRLADGLVRSVSDGDVVDGFRIDLGSPTPAVTDRFLLQPVTRSANEMRRVLDDVRGIAAASPVTASASPANTGTATVASLTVVNAAIDPELSASVTFTSATGNYAWELRNRTTNALVSSGTATWSAGSSIALNGFELRLDGVPRNGDVFSAVKTTFPGANNGNALALVALRDNAFVGRSLQGGVLGGGNTVTNAYASAMAAIGVRVQGAAMASQVSTSVATQAEQVRSSGAGVNLDEEAARLLQFQQSYQAASKVLQIAQSVFDTLLDAAGA
ncbi:MAG TPA: flagellar hook-associated protein FlgK [Rubrivivax sp.]